MVTCVFGDYSTSLAIFKGPTLFSYPNLQIHLRVNWPFFFSKGATRNLEKTKTTEFAWLSVFSVCWQSECWLGVEWFDYFPTPTFYSLMTAQGTHRFIGLIAEEINEYVIISVLLNLSTSNTSLILPPLDLMSCSMSHFTSLANPAVSDHPVTISILHDLYPFHSIQW